MSHWTDPQRAPLSPFRIRLGNEEVALPVGVTLVGRDPACRISVPDTLVSRRHARIQCDQDYATVEDLDSRNGTRVNGVPIVGPHTLRDGDRLGIGAYELVFSVVDRDDLSDVPTGLLTICVACGNGYSASLDACPSCGASRSASPSSNPQRSDDTVRGRWSLGMLLELIGKAIITDRPDEVEKLMREASNIVSDRIAARSAIEPDELRALAESARWLAKAQKSAAWLDWIAGIDAQLARGAD